MPFTHYKIDAVSPQNSTSQTDLICINFIFFEREKKITYLLEYIGCGI